MSLFEDLVEELKEENLLEETVIESRRFGNRRTTQESFEDAGGSVDEIYKSDSREFDPDFETTAEETFSQEEDLVSHFVEEEIEDAELDSDESAADAAVESEEHAPAAAKREFSPLASKLPGESGKQYFRRRATDEVKTLQMVDHIITRVEKEQAKINSPLFDDLKVKQALHRFLQLDEEANATEVAEIEFLLLQETENWYTALTMRDRELTVENLRCYCESAVPSLSNQALLALARFYRNAPFSELVRSKFDLIITKLYTSEAGEGKRDVVLPQESLEKDIQELYKDWSSVPLYSADGTEDEFEFGAMGFVDFVEEAKKSHSFDDLVSKDFFKRLNDFKERANESFFAPKVVAAAIRCNVAVGNRYLELIENENGGRRPDELLDKYGFLSDSAITEAISKVFTAHEEDELAKEEARKKKAKQAEKLFNVEKLSDASTKLVKKKAEWYKANKKLVVATALTVLLGVFYFFFSSYILPSTDMLVSTDVQELNLANSEFGKYVTTARISKNTAYAVTNESWTKLPKQQKTEMMRKLLATGADKGFIQINFLDGKGKRVGFASATKLELED